MGEECGIPPLLQMVIQMQARPGTCPGIAPEHFLDSLVFVSYESRSWIGDAAPESERSHATDRCSGELSGRLIDRIENSTFDRGD